MEPGSIDEPKPRGDRVDLNDLEWEDRERVLRLLFSKMNAGVPPTALMKRVSAKQQVKREQEMRQISEMGVYLAGEGDQPADEEEGEYLQEEEQEEEPLAIEYDR